MSLFRNPFSKPQPKHEEPLEVAAEAGSLEDRVLDALRGVLDPELGLNVVDLGLVYGLYVDGGKVRVMLTMTTPACPLGEEIVRDADQRVRAVEGVESADIQLVWHPAWGPERMSPSAREALGWGR
jgi:metal-sulfur cluster biosynthetic enzyme